MESSFILLILVLIVLLILAIYCIWMSCKLKFFNDTKARIIFKDTLSLIIIPLLVNVFGNKLHKHMYITSLIILVLLFILYLLADIWNKPKTNDKHVILHIILIIAGVLGILIVCLVFKYLEIKLDFDIR